VDVLNPIGTGDNDLLGLDLFTPDSGLGLSLDGTELLGFGNPRGDTVIPLDTSGLDKLTTALRLTPDSALVDAIRHTAGPNGALIALIRVRLRGCATTSRLVCPAHLTSPLRSPLPATHTQAM
jgi:hypothetical protein